MPYGQHDEHRHRTQRPRTKGDLSAAYLAGLASIPQETQGLLLRMFADPYILEKDERPAWSRSCGTA